MTAISHSSSDADGNAVSTFMTDEQSRAVCRKIDRHILPLLVVRLLPQLCSLYIESLIISHARTHPSSHTTVGLLLADCASSAFDLILARAYWLEDFRRLQLDKSVVGYGSIFGLQEDAGLHGDQSVLLIACSAIFVG